MKKAAPQYQRNSLSQGHFNISLNCLLLCDSVSRILIATVQLGAVMTYSVCRIDDAEDFIFDEAFSLLDDYACSVLSESVVFGGFLTPQEA